MKKIIIVFLLMLYASLAPALAQGEEFVPHVPTPEQTELRVWTSGSMTHARVTFTFPTGGYRIIDWGAVERQGNDLFVNVPVERWTGGTTQAIVVVEHFYDLGALAAGAHTFTVRSRGTIVKSVAFDPAQVVERWEEVSLPQSGVVPAIFTVGNATFARVTLGFPETGYRVASWGAVVRSGNDFSVTVRVERFTGRAETRRSQAHQVFVLGENLPPHETFTLTVRFPDGVAWSSRPWTPEGQRVQHANTSDHPYFFVRQHYLDFFNREPDSGGLTFWTDQILDPCGGRSDCMENSRINPSGAFFLSMEFRGTGYFVYRLYKAAYGRMPRFNELMPDARIVGRDIVVGREGWETALDASKRQFVADFVARQAFVSQYPATMTPEQYVDALNANTAKDGQTALTAVECRHLADALRDGSETRASVLSIVAEDADFEAGERNSAFVQMQYMGYLRRDADGEGFNFWLRKLDEHGGDFHRAEMVKSFLVSGEYRGRFGN